MEAIDALSGKTVGELRAEHSITATSHVDVLRAALLSSDQVESVKELFGRYSFKVSRILPSGRQAQLMSFPNFEPFSFAEETWEAAAIRSILGSLVIVGLQHSDGDAQGEDRDGCVVLGATAATPDSDAWEIIEQEWREARRLVGKGELSFLRTDVESRCVFVKRKGTGGSTDVQDAPGGQETPHLGFWLTGHYLRDLFADAGWTEREQAWPIGRPRIYIATASASEARAHFDASVARPIDIPSASSLVTGPGQVKRASARASDELVRVWGAKPGPSNVRLWDQLLPGDWLFFYWDKAYASVTRVVEKPDEPQPALARSLWGEDASDGQTWELAYYLDAPTPISVPAETVAEILGTTNMGFRVVKDERLIELASRHGSIGAIVQAILDAGSPAESPLERAMREWEEELDVEEIARIDALHTQMKRGFDSNFATPEAVEAMSIGDFYAFMNQIDARNTLKGHGIFRFNMPLPVRQDAKNYRYLADRWPAFQEAIKTLLFGDGELATRIDAMLAEGSISYYVNPELAIASALMTFVDPGRFTGIQRMQLKRSKARAVGIDTSAFEGSSLGEEFVALEQGLADLPERHGRRWSWATRMRFYFSDAFKRNLEPTDAVPDAYFIFLQKTPEDSDYGDHEGERYPFDSNVTGRVPLLQANGGHFVYYRPQKGADPQTAQTFFGSGTVVRVEPGGEEGATQTYVAQLTDYVPFDHPVPRSSYQPPGWNHQHSIAAISREVYEEIMRRGFEGTGPVSGYDMAWLMRETFWAADRLEGLIEALGKRPVVLAGPPGTGKTWVARALVKHLTSGELTRMRIVQFHPSYGYEEFMEGLRPTWDEAKGGITFQPVDGVVLRLAAQAEAMNASHYLIIDEMNRANLPRVFGELMFLFEYRNPEDAIELQYSGYTEDGTARTFHLPENLHFIGTMNTADRSIRSIDSALRRRFEVFDCPPDASILEAWYAHPQRESDVADLVAGFVRLNESLTSAFDEHHTIGHTFFMEDAMTKKRLRNTWERQVAPLIAEYFFDQPDRLGEFSLPAFWPSAT